MQLMDYFLQIDLCGLSVNADEQSTPAQIVALTESVELLSQSL